MLIIEDNPLIAEHVVAIIEEAGFKALGPFATNDSARDVLDNPAMIFDAALLDLQLDRSSLMIADQLRRMAVPFVFVTGDRAGIPLDYRDRPVCEKPFSSRDLLEALALAFDQQESIKREGSGEV